jgi:hypothetical protein
MCCTGRVHVVILCWPRIYIKYIYQNHVSHCCVIGTIIKKNMAFNLFNLLVTIFICEKSEMPPPPLNFRNSIPNCVPTSMLVSQITQFINM